MNVAENEKRRRKIGHRGLTHVPPGSFTKEDRRIAGMPYYAWFIGHITWVYKPALAATWDSPSPVHVTLKPHLTSLT